MGKSAKTKLTRREREPAAAPAHPGLVVLRDAPDPSCGSVRASRRGKWRALSLISIHVAVAAHVAHWWITGRTVTPVEPSEAMQTLGQGLVNAGFVLFVALILSTALLGRFFCGWGCHVVALQDLCTWLLRRAGIRPRPFRSRLLVWAPLAAALWMFVVPSVVRMAAGQARPPLTPHFTTAYFWDRFPGPFVAALTFSVCGFLIVYVLGNKGFCTYGCPYGGVFGLADQIAVGKIRVTDACEGCGHCTATCTSNVRVHAEVRDFGMVVDPGCMKCMDCIDVCPKDALYFGFGRPTLAKGAPRVARAPRPYDFTAREELALGGLFLFSVLVLRALYDLVPFLLALGLGAISAYVLLTAFRTFRAADLRFTRFRLRAGGATTAAGRGFRWVALVWALFLVHSATVQALTLAGSRMVDGALARADASTAPPGDDVRDALHRGADLLRRAEAIGLTTSPNELSRMGAAYARIDEGDLALQYYREAVDRTPEFSSARFELARVLEASGRSEEAIYELKEVVRRRPELPGAHEALARLLLAAGRQSEATEIMESLRKRRPADPSIRLTYGIVLAQSGQVDRGLEETRQVLLQTPDDPTALYDLGQLLAKRGDFEEALDALERAIAAAPGVAETELLDAKVATRLERWPLAIARYDGLLKRDPWNAQLATLRADAIRRAGTADASIAADEASASGDRAARFRLAFLYKAVGRNDDAARLAAEFTARGGN